MEWVLLSSLAVKSVESSVVSAGRHLHIQTTRCACLCISFISVLFCMWLCERLPGKLYVYVCIRGICVHEYSLIYACKCE